MISISFVIPIYNVEQYVRRCLMSVMAQEEVFDGSLECIIVDDSSPDRSVDIVRDMISCYQGRIRFKLFEHGKNLGLSATRNTGLLNTTGDYVMFVDSDDYLMPNSLYYFVKYLNKYPDVDVVVGNVKNCKGGDLLIPHIREPWLINDNNVFVSRMFHHQIYLYAWNKLIKRDLLLSNHIMFEDGIIYEDQCWSYELFSHISSILLLPQVTYVYENNPSSITNTTFTQEKAGIALRSYTISINKMLDNPPLPSRYIKNMTVDYLLFMANFLMNGVDVLFRSRLPRTLTSDFRKVRIRILLRSLHHGRIMLSCFFLLLFPPLCHLQKFRVFRHHYYDIESVVNRLCHLTDFLHRK